MRITLHEDIQSPIDGKQLQRGDTVTGAEAQAIMDHPLLSKRATPVPPDKDAERWGSSQQPASGE